MATATKQPWTEAKANRAAEAMGVYRNYVVKVANDEPMDGKDVDKLGEAMLLLDLPNEQFDADVAILKRHRAMKTERPDPDKEYRQWVDETAELGKAIDSKTFELGDLKSRHKHAQVMANIVANHKAGVAQIEMENPRVFASIEDAVTRRHDVVRERVPGYETGLVGDPRH